MATSTAQSDRLIRAITPLGKDVLLAVGFSGREAISELFHFTLDARAERAKPVAFEKLLGHPIAVEIELPQKKVRHFHGICTRVRQGESDANFTNYSLEIVPQFWLLTKSVRSRIFQQQSVPDILKKVLTGLDTEYQLQGKFEPREYCVQYRESDFAFASRLMEEEGIFYFFKHAAGGHKMVLANSPQAHPAVPVGPEKITYKTGTPEADSGDVITEMGKSQHWATGKFTRWDHTFEMPHKNQEQVKQVVETTTIGKVSHPVRPPNAVESYDWPGGYAQRFDAVEKGGGDQAGELGKIDPAGKGTVEVLAQREAAACVAVFGNSHCRHFTSGHKFSVQTIASDLAASPIKIDGDYVLTEVIHTARIGENLRSGSGASPGSYSNTFTALPMALPFRPARTTAKPVVHGCQTAQVVGPPKEEICTDKFGRVKVQFHWDREGKRDAGSSCWCRVAFGSAGRNWGMISIPRVGQEVVVDFLEGDPDHPIIVGCVYNPDQMPSEKLPDHKTRSHWKSNSTLGGDGYNEIRFEDKKDLEQVYIHAQRNMDQRVRNDSLERVGVNRHLRVGFHLPKDHQGDASGETKKGSQFEEVAVNQHLKVHKDKVEHVGGSVQLLIGGGDGDGNLDVHVKKNKTELTDGTSDLHVKKAVKEAFDDKYHLKVGNDRLIKVGGKDNLTVVADRNTKVGGSDSLTVGDKRQEKVGSTYAVDAGQEIHLKAGMKVVIEAGAQISLKGPGGFIDIGPAGVTIQGTMVLINSGGAAGSGSGSSPSSPAEPENAKDAQDAAPTKPTDADLSKTGQKSY